MNSPAKSIEVESDIYAPRATDPTLSVASGAQLTLLSGQECTHPSYGLHRCSQAQIREQSTEHDWSQTIGSVLLWLEEFRRLLPLAQDQEFRRKSGDPGSSPGSGRRRM